MRSIIGMAVLAAAVLLSSTMTAYPQEAVSPGKPPSSPSQEELWSMMLGKWYGRQPTQDGGIRQQIVQRASNGTYRVTLRITDKDGEVMQQTEVGHWGVSGPVYFSIFRAWLDGDQAIPTDPADPYNYDAYRILTLTGDLFEYEHFTTGNKYAVERVPSDFDFPE